MAHSLEGRHTDLRVTGMAAKPSRQALPGLDAAAPDRAGVSGQLFPKVPGSIIWIQFTG